MKQGPAPGTQAHAEGLSEEVCRTIVDRINRVCGTCTVYLFGSYATGSPTPSSDLDIAVIMEQVSSKIEAAAAIWDTLRDIPLPKDIVVATQEEFEFYRNEPGSIFRTISQKGKVLHGDTHASAV